MTLLPGTIVEYEGETFLIEEVTVSVTMQKIERRLRPGTNLWDETRPYDWTPEFRPCYVRVEGTIDGPEVAKIIHLIAPEAS